jgi:hypothetical protein
MKQNDLSVYDLNVFCFPLFSLLYFNILIYLRVLEEKILTYAKL